MRRNLLDPSFGEGLQGILDKEKNSDSIGGEDIYESLVSKFHTYARNTCCSQIQCSWKQYIYKIDFK